MINAYIPIVYEGLPVRVCVFFFDEILAFCYLRYEKYEIKKKYIQIQNASLGNFCPHMWTLCTQRLS